MSSPFQPLNLPDVGRWWSWKVTSNEDGVLVSLRHDPTHTTSRPEWETVATMDARPSSSSIETAADRIIDALEDEEFVKLAQDFYVGEYTR